MEEGVRLREPNRKQLILQPTDIEGLIDPEHPARAIWRVLETMDLSQFCEPIRAREGVAGRDASDPRMLLALWLYAISQGVNSAREIARLCEAHSAYRWICGGVSVNYHTLSDFRSAHPAALDELMTRLLGSLLKRGLLTLERVAQDGTRVRTSAGAASFRRRHSLERCLAQAQAHLAALEQQAAADLSARQQAARERAARDYEQRCRQALAEFEQLSEHPAAGKNRKRELRVSTTDRQARVMKLADGGYAPAYNLQLATDTQSRLSVGALASNSGSDSQQLAPMQDEIERRSKLVPRQHLVDGGYHSFAAVEHSAERGIEVFSPPRHNRTYHIDPLAPQPHDSPAIADYRQRMASAEGQAIYRERAATAETVNADLKCWRGLDRLLVRGLNKVTSVMLLAVLTYNLMRCIRLGWL